MAHIWVRAEERPDESRVGLTPEGAAALIAAGHRVTVERSGRRVIPAEAYAEAGCALAEAGDWHDAPADALVFGLKELDPSGPDLRHAHAMFGHAYKGQPGARALLERFARGGGALYDLEYLTDEAGRRVAAFGTWAGYAGAALSALAWAAQDGGGTLGPVRPMPDAESLAAEVRRALGGRRPRVLVIGAQGRVGRGAHDLCARAGLPVTAWDMAETAHGGPFPQIAEHDIFLNCILAGPSTPLFVPPEMVAGPRRLRVIGDIACDPGSPHNPVPLYESATDWDRPVLRVAEAPPLDIMAIDNLPSLLPRESSEDFAAQLLPTLMAADRLDAGPWARARAEFDRHIATLKGDTT